MEGWYGARRTLSSVLAHIIGWTSALDYQVTLGLLHTDISASVARPVVMFRKLSKTDP